MKNYQQKVEVYLFKFSLRSLVLVKFSLRSLFMCLF